MIDVILLDSDDHARHRRCVRARRRAAATSAYVVDLAWLRTTPWRERLAASFDPPERLPALRQLRGRRSATRRARPPARSLLAGWLASRLRWEREPLQPRTARVDGAASRRDEQVAIYAASPPSRRLRAGRGDRVAAASGYSLSLDRATGGLCARERHDDGVERGGRSWVPRAARAGSSERACARRCSATRPTAPALDSGAGVLPGVSVTSRSSRIPARACAAMLVAPRSAAATSCSPVARRQRRPTRSSSRPSRGRHRVIDTTFWFGDERCVAPDDERSNYAMVKESLLDPLGDGPPDGAPDEGRARPDDGAEEYERQLRAAGPPDSTSSCSGSAPTAIALRCSPTSRPCRSAPGWSSGSTRRASSRSCPGSAHAPAIAGPGRSCSWPPANRRRRRWRARSARTPSPIRTCRPHWWRRWPTRSSSWSIRPRRSSWRNTA